jgi:hypothetical protein
MLRCRRDFLREMHPNALGFPERIFLICFVETWACRFASGCFGRGSTNLCAVF